MARFYRSLGLVIALLCAPQIGHAAEITQSRVTVGGVWAVLLRPAHPRASLILLTSGDGRVEIDEAGEISYGRGNQLVRTRMAYAQRGFAVLVPDRGYKLSDAVSFMASIKRPVTVAGTSRGTQRAAEGIAAGARPDRLVLTSGFLSRESGDNYNVMSILGDPSLLPPTLVVHHRQDGCRKTAPGGVEPFLAWAKAHARVTWLSGGEPEGDPCEARGYHGFMGIDDKVVSAIAGFAGR